MKLLHIDSSIQGASSISRKLTASIVAGLSADGDPRITYRDLVAEDQPHVTVKSLPWDHPLAAKAGTLDPADEAARNDSQKVLDEFLEADVVVIGAPMYNFGVSTQLKSWVDRIIVPGKTFRTTKDGTEGLAGDKRVIVAVARGWTYERHTESYAAEHVETFLRAALAFIGVDHPEFIVAEGVAYGEEQRGQALRRAEERIRALAA